jgi:hypothetical protein
MWDLKEHLWVKAVGTYSRITPFFSFFFGNVSLIGENYIPGELVGE